MGLLIRVFFYFAYYVLMTDYFKVEPLQFPYMIISIYFVITTILFPYVNKRVSIWIEGNKVTSLVAISKISMPFIYVFTSIFFIIDSF